MSANTKPIFTLTPKNGFATWTNSNTANVKNDGTGASIGSTGDMVLVYTAGSNGAFVQKVRLIPSANTASTNSTATVARIYRSTQISGATTNTNTHRLDEVACPQQTLDQTTAATNFIEIPLGFALAPNEALLFSMHHVAAANTVWQCIAFVGDY